MKLVMTFIGLGFVFSQLALAENSKGYNCGVFKAAAHEFFLDDGYKGYDLRDVILEKGVQYPELGTYACFSGNVVSENGETRFLTIDSIVLPSQGKLGCKTEDANHPSGIVRSVRTLRILPAGDVLNVLTVVGDVVVIEDELYPWIKIRTQNSIEGWIASDSIVKCN